MLPGDKLREAYFWTWKKKYYLFPWRGGGDPDRVLSRRPSIPSGSLSHPPQPLLPPSSSIQKVWDPCGAEVSRLRPRRPAGEGEGASAPLLASQDARRPHIRSPRRRPGQRELLGKSRPRGNWPWFPQGGRGLRGGFPPGRAGLPQKRAGGGGAASQGREEPAQRQRAGRGVASAAQPQ